jgi:hypothetical protein
MISIPSLFRNIIQSRKNRIFVSNSALATNEKEAILLLPGFGVTFFGTTKMAAFFFDRGYDVFIPSYIARNSLESTLHNLDKFIAEQNLMAYKKLNVFSYIIGSWTLNEWIKENPKNNISAIVYDRSPLQERVPFALNKDLPRLSRLFFGKILREFSVTEYPSIIQAHLSIGIIIESKATNVMKKHKKTALSLGPVSWLPSDLNQEHSDYYFTWLTHDEMYSRFDIIGEEIMQFFKTGAFSKTAQRVPFNEDPFISFQEG